jgi:hypothetical protein
LTLPGKTNTILIKYRKDAMQLDRRAAQKVLNLIIKDSDSARFFVKNTYFAG